MSRKHKSRPKHFATLRELDAKALRNILADKLLKIKAETLAKTLSHVNSDSLLHTLSHTLAELQVEKCADTVCDVKALAPVEVLAYMLQ